jgi:hypothetical protein
MLYPNDDNYWVANPALDLEGFEVDDDYEADENDDFAGVDFDDYDHDAE